MEIPRQHYTEEFKQEAVKLVRESGLSIAEAGRRLNISSMTLKNWVYRSKSPNAGKSTGRPVSDIEAENRDYQVNVHETVEKEHGRIETRRCTVTDYPLPDSERAGWSGLQTLVMVESTRDIKNVVTKERRYYVSSLEPDAAIHLAAIRSHWSIENSLHWVLDVVFKEDDCKVRDKAAAENLSIMRKCALTLVRNMSDKLGLSRRMHKASVDEDYLISMFGGMSSLLNTLQPQNTSRKLMR